MAVRIAGVTLPNKRLVISLTYIYGIGNTRAGKILDALKISRDIHPDDLAQDDVNKLRETVEKQYRVEGELRRDVSANIKRLKDILAYRGLRHMKHLPVRGQRTKTNCRTVRGNVRKTMGSGRRAAGEKT